MFRGVYLKAGPNWEKTLEGWDWSPSSKDPTQQERDKIERILKRLATSDEDISMTIMSGPKTNPQLSSDGLTIPYRKIFESGSESYLQHKRVRVVKFSDPKAFAFELPIAIKINRTNKLELRYLKLKFDITMLQNIDCLSEACVSYHCSDYYKGVGICLN